MLAPQLFELLSIYPRRPDNRIGKSSGGWLRISATGISAPPRFSPSCPHLLRRFYHARLYGEAGVSLCPLPVMARPVAIGCLSWYWSIAPGRRNEQTYIMCVLLFFFGGSWRTG